MTLIREASQLVGSPLSNWIGASSLGGINLRQAVLHVPAAYIGSLVVTSTRRRLAVVDSDKLHALSAAASCILLCQ